MNRILFTLLIVISFFKFLIADEKPQKVILTPPPPKEVKIIPSENSISLISESPQVINSNIISCEDILANHFNAEINCTFKEALTVETIRKRFSKKKWKKDRYGIFIPAKGHKVVFQNLSGKSYVFIVTEDYSLCSSKTSNYIQDYYDHPQNGVKYFLISYKNREIPTYFPNKTLVMLSKWEKAWIDTNHVSQQYFDEHIFVKNVKFEFSDSVDFNRPFTFNIDYFWQVDWAKVHLNDQLRQYNLNTSQKKFIKVIESIDQILPIDTIVQKVETISDSIRMDLNRCALSSRKEDIAKLRAYIYRYDDEGNMIKPDMKIVEELTKNCYKRLVAEFTRFYKSDKTRMNGKIFLKTGEIETKVFNDSPYY